MSLTTIPNQPINFQSPEVIAACPDTEPPLLVSENDPLIFQFLQERCDGAEQYLAPIDTSDWIDNPGWTIGAGTMTLVVNNGGEYVEESLWIPTLSEVYDVEITVDSVAAEGFFVQVGGTQVLVNTPGTSRFVVTCQIAMPTRVVAVGDTSAGVISDFKVYEANRDFKVAVVQAGSDFVVYDPIADPELFVYKGQHVVFNAPFPEFLEGCFNIELRDECGAYTVTYCSQAVQVIPCGNTVMVRVCLDYDGLGFVAGYFTVRLRASLVNPTWEYETAQERLSNGRINRYYIDRQAIYQFSIETASQFLHPFLAALAMFDHFYIDTTEWSVDAEGYTPDYGDGRVSTGAVVLTVRKKQELMRRVLCDDLLEGCNPANDPICPTANAELSTVLSEGDLFVRVDVYSNLGFIVSAIEWTLNGVDQDSVPVGGVPGAYALGDVVPGDVVRVTFVNAKDPSCNDTRASYTVQSPCEFLDFPEGCQYFSFDLTGGSATISAASTSEGINYLTVVFPDGSTETREDGAVALEGAIDGQYCVYSSDSEGTPIADTWTVDLFIQGSFVSAISNLDLSGVSGIVGSVMANSGLRLAFVELDAGSAISMEGLKFFSASDCLVGSGFTVISSAIEFFAIQSCTMAEAPPVTGYPNMKNLSFSNNQLPPSEVNSVLVEASATFVELEGDIILLNQTPAAPPSGAGLTAKAELEGRSPGWTITVDP